MTIKIRSDDIKLWIPVPTGLAFNDLTALLIPKIMVQNGVTITAENSVAITPKQARKLMRGIRKCIRHHRGLTLVEVETADGQHVEITL